MTAPSPVPTCPLPAQETKVEERAKKLSASKVAQAEESTRTAEMALGRSEAEAESVSGCWGIVFGGVMLTCVPDLSLGTCTGNSCTSLPPEGHHEPS